MIETPTTEHIKSVVQAAYIMRDPTVEFLAEGYGNYNFVLAEAGRKLVFRYSKQSEPQFSDSLANEYILLRYFHAAGIDCVPKAIYYDATCPGLIESYLEGTKMSLGELTKPQLQQYITTLHKIFTLDPANLAKFCDQEGFSDLPPAGTIPEAVTIYGYNRLAIAKAGHYRVEPDLLDWLEVRLAENMTMAQHLQHSQMIGISVGDLQSRVILSPTGDVQLFDFDHARYSYSIGLGMLSTLNVLSAEQLTFVIDYYAKLTDIPVANLHQQIAMEKQLTLINDVVWAAMQWANTGESKFKTLTYERKQLAERFLSDKQQ